jgi:hypothetical protein
VVEHALGEGLATGVGSQVSSEAEGLVDDCKKRKGLKPGIPQLDNYLDKL